MLSTMSKKRESWGQKGRPQVQPRCKHGTHGRPVVPAGCHLDGRRPRVQPHVGAGVQGRDDVGGQELLGGVRGEENHPTDLRGHSGVEAVPALSLSGVGR